MKSRDESFGKITSNEYNTSHLMFDEMESCLFEFPVLMWRSDIDGKRLFFNRYWLEFTGISKEQATADKWLDLIHPEDKDHYLHEYRKSVELKELFNIEYKLKRFDGSYRTIIEYGKPMQVNDGNYMGFMGTCFDVTDHKEKEETLRKEKEEIYSRFFYSNNSIILLIDPDTGKIVDANHSAIDFYGYSKKELLKKYINDLNMLSKAKVKKRMDLIKKDKPNFISLNHKIASGEIKEVEGFGGMIFVNGKQLIYAIINDITEQRKSEEQLKLAYNEINQIFNTTANGMRVIDRDFHVVRINQTMLNLLHLTEKETIGQKCYNVFPGKYCNTSKCPVQKILSGDETVQYEVTKILPDKTEIPILLTAKPLTDSKGEIVGIVEDLLDLTEHKKNEQKIRHTAYHDTLTNLPNRLYFLEKLHEKLLDRSEEQVLAVMFLDLDEFKYINDNYGNAIGNKTLINVAKQLTNFVTKGDVVARLGGDEFTVLLSNVSGVEEVANIAKKLLEEFEKPFIINGLEIYLSLSIGISLFPVDGLDAETILKHADIAMYNVKDKKKNSYAFFSASNKKYFANRFRMENHLRHALKRDELQLYYQPQLDTATNEIKGLEALIRWNNSALGFVSPGEFIPLAEETGLIGSIGYWVILTACTHLKQLKNEGYPPIRVAINLSVKQLQEPHLTKNIREIIKVSEIDPSYLEFEITESIALTNFENNLKILKELKDLGIKIALDDFGTGYSSLSYLKMLPLDVLKIDKTFIDELTTDANNRAIAEAIIRMAHNLKLRVIAEGVENEQNLDYLKKQKCDMYQGFLFSKPVPLDEVKLLLDRPKLMKVEV